MKRSFLEFQPGSCLIAVFALVVLPVKWVVGWLLAVTIHELGHFGALKLLGIPVYSIKITLSGLYMHTASVTSPQETVIAAAGPVASGILVLMAPWVPHTACCAFFQLLFNLLPFEGFDGWRILKNGLKLLLSEKNTEVILKFIRISVLTGIVLIAFWLHWGGILLLAGFLLFVRRGHITFPCKRGKQIVQWSK